MSLADEVVLCRKSQFYPARVKCSVWRNPEEFDEKSGTPLGIQTGGKMASPVPSACCVVLAAVVMVYAQRHSQMDTHVQYERLGADVTMQCGAMDWDAAVTWTANGTDIDESHLNGSHLVLRNVDLAHSGQYACYEGSSWHLKYQTYLKVGTSPKEPVLMCRSNNYPKGFYCSWHLPSPTYIPNAFNITVMHGPRELVCEKDAFPKNRCHIRYLQLFSTVKYKVTLTVTNALGRNATTITFDEFAIVKPDPPENVVAKPVSNNPRRLEVRWQNPSSWPDPESFPLKFFLRYRPLILDQWQHVELSDGTSHTITDAYAGKEYIIQVAAKDNDIGTWSDWSVAVHATPWTEEPKHLTTEAQVAETTTTGTSSFVPPPTTKICDLEAVVGSGAVTVSWAEGLVLAAVGVLFI
ncbi:ciliary neurotrophic factor receptor subunit alpha isoform X2 [Trachemys scripta elegans]|uniref:ciliary neurotrophic factor receptor subunit alpha isoform X1 n=2 Tax=Trachemys scripta elegans TaxID=31138 RepID=UPI001553ECDF|nr:ciliary neurotrophic factor receptor subunit alpha isoform X1 [Trachemys scripta elegans]XP_034630247.1 ciliary neurotrophic factor receptor subunit alpha isoform X2 [Trachemys scripta elegans]